MQLLEKLDSVVSKFFTFSRRWSLQLVSLYASFRGAAPLYFDHAPSNAHSFNARLLPPPQPPSPCIPEGVWGEGRDMGRGRHPCVPTWDKSRAHRGQHLCPWWAAHTHIHAICQQGWGGHAPVVSYSLWGRNEGSVPRRHFAQHILTPPDHAENMVR